MTKNAKSSHARHYKKLPLALARPTRTITPSSPPPLLPLRTTMAVPPISPPKNELAASAAGKAGAKRKRPHQASAAGASDAAPSPASKRNKSPGVRVIGGRIYDSELGKTCHQCRQKTMDFSAACSNVKGGKKPCPIRFCHKCLLNRYGEKAEEMASREDWCCPKCRGICNCSFCMKKKGQQPTGMLIHTAKATGYSSVSEMLQLYQMRSEAKDVDQEVNAVSNRPHSSGKLVASGRKQGKENSPAPSRILELVDQATKPSEEKGEIVDVKVKRKSKVPKLKRENSNGVMGNLTKGKTRKKENFASKNMKRGTLVKSEKKDDVVDEKEAVSTDFSGKKMSMNDRKAGCNREMQACNGSNIVEEKGDLHKDKKKCMKKRQMDIRKAFSDGNVKDTLNKEGGNGSEPAVSVRACKENEDALPSVANSLDSVVVMPEGTQLTAVAGVELQAEDVGPALQFLEFCSAFGKVLDVKKGQPESVLRELASGRGARRGLNSLIIQFYIKLLSRIQKEEGERPLSCSANDGTWQKALKKCVTESQCALKELPLDWLNKGAAGYVHLHLSEKLRLLNFLCDELLGTEEMRNWIDKENMGFIEGRREAREKVLAAKEEEKRLKKKLKDEVAEAMLQLRNGAPLTISEHKDLVSKIKTETDKAHSEVLGSLDIFRKKKQRSDAVRTEPILLEGDGRAYWRLKSYDSSRIVLQDIGNWGLIVPEDKWFIYDDQQEKLVEKHLHSSRNQKRVRQKVLKSIIFHSCKDYAEDELPKNISQLSKNNA